jgi:hypothetical protein
MGGGKESGRMRQARRTSAVDLLEAIERLQREREPARIAERARGQVVGDLLALDAHLPRQPPDHRW